MSVSSPVPTFLPPIFSFMALLLSWICNFLLACGEHLPCCHVQDNILHGRFLAELTKEVLNDLEVSKYQHAEYRISIYGRKRVEWDILAAWYCQNKLYSDNVLWLIQVPAP